MSQLFPFLFLGGCPVNGPGLLISRLFFWQSELELAPHLRGQGLHLVSGG